MAEPQNKAGGLGGGSPQGSGASASFLVPREEVGHSVAQFLVLVGHTAQCVDGLRFPRLRLGSSSLGGSVRFQSPGDGQLETWPRHRH